MVFGMGGGGQGGCERRIEVFVKIKKNGLGGGGVGHGRCERRSEVFVKLKKKTGRVRVAVNEELNF